MKNRSDFNYALKLRTAKNLNFFGEINVETKILKNQFFRTF